MGMCIRVDGECSPCWRALLLAVALMLIAAGPAVAQDPAGPAAVEPHWSPYTAPDSFPPDQQVYIIVRGDCLWNLAARFYSDPLLWPQIWDANRYITDAHWIYPGDPLVIPGAPAVGADRMVGGEDEFGDEPMPGEAVAELGDEPVPPDEMVDPQGGDRYDAAFAIQESGALVNPVDVYCAALIVPDFDAFDYTISGAEESEKVAQTVGDVVYIDAGTEDGIGPGDRYSILHPFGKVDHPATGKKLGWAMRQVGELEVLCANEHDASATIIHGCAGVSVGDQLLPWEDLPIPVVETSAPPDRCEDLGEEQGGYIVHFPDGQFAAAEGNLGVIDMGSDDGVSPGDFFTVYRLQQGHQLMLGELVVLRTERETASIKLITSLREIYVGDQVSLKN